MPQYNDGADEPAYVYVWLGEDEWGIWSIVAYQFGEGLRALVSTSESKARDMQPLAETVVRSWGTAGRLAKCRVGETLLEIKP